VGAQLEVFIGPMFSGKTDALIARFEELSAAGEVLVALKASMDTRHPSNVIVSHSEATIPARPVDSVASLLSAVGSGAQGLLVDEVQFLTAELVAALLGLRERGVRLVVAGLDRDFAGRRFEATTALCSHATEVNQLLATCTRCGRAAALTQRLRDGRPVGLDEPQIVVGDSELYEPRCERCWSEERRSTLGTIVT
jgi:thymidine kinase